MIRRTLYFLVVMTGGLFCLPALHATTPTLNFDHWRGSVNCLVDYGLAGDGVTDDSALIQSCIDNNLGKELIFPKTNASISGCDYFLSSSIKPKGNGMTLRGEGGGHEGGTTFCTPAGVTAVVLNNSVGGSPPLCQGCSIERLNFQGSEGWLGSSSATCIIPPGISANSTQITNIVGTAGTVTATVVSTTNMFAGGTVVIDGTVNYNGIFIVLAGGFDATHFTFSLPGTIAAETQGNATFNTTGTSAADGLMIRGSFSRLDRLNIKNYGRHGINIDSTCGTTSCTADDNDVTNVFVDSNRGDGIHLRGSDSQVSTFKQADVYRNQVWGIHDEGFLGNTYLQPQATGNHIDAGTPPAGTSITSISMSNHLVTVASAAHGLTQGQGVVISGTTNYNNTWFVYQVPDNGHFTFTKSGADQATENSGTARMASCTQAWSAAAPASAFDGGPYKSVGASQFSTWITPYSENGQGISKFGAGAIVLGGLNNSCATCLDYTLNPFVFSTGSNPSFLGSTFTYNRPTDLGGFNLSLQGGLTVDQTSLISFNNHSGTPLWTITQTTGSGNALQFHRGAAGGPIMVGMTNGSTGSGILDLSGDGSGAQVRFGNNNTNSFYQFFGGAGPSLVANLDTTGKWTTYNAQTTADLGIPVIVGTPQHLLNQTANLAATNVLASATAGTYEVCFDARTTASGTGTTATVSVRWTDEGGLKTFPSATWALNAVDVTGQVNGCQILHSAASQNIQVLTTGTYGTSVYALDAYVKRVQ